VGLDKITVITLDEADRMADEGFTPQVEWILRHITAEHQTMLFSATLDGQVGHLVNRYLKSPVEVAVDSATETVGTMRHLFLAIHRLDKDKVIEQSEMTY
jgi:superfamily II DNA/RNA helicase